MNNNIDKKIQAIKVKNLSDQESNQVWQRINTGISKPIPTVNFLLILIHKPMIQIALIIILLFSGSAATVAAANDAKPGDLLFPLDRAIENVQIKIASEDKKDELKVKFALERAEEMEEIILESLDDDVDILPMPTATSTTATTTDASRQGISIDHDKIEQVYTTAFDYIEQVKKELLNGGNEQAVGIIDDVIDRLNLSLDELPDNLKVEIKKDYDNNKLNIEVKSEENEGEIKFEIEGGKSEYKSEDVDGNKVKIKVEDDGKVQVEYEEQDEDDSDKKGAEDVDSVLNIEYKNNSDDKENSIEQDNDDDLLDDVMNDSNIENILVLKKVEAESDDDGIKIKVKFEDLEAEFLIDESTREAVVNFVADKYSLDKDDVDAKLQFEL